ncbi:hypothetical protein J7K05_00770 [bacterium]|nr:hypothetical protein [bacterium]
MNLPFTIKFYKKLELFQTLQQLNAQADHQKESLWPIEKRILRWTYWGHKHLGSPIFEFDLFEKAKTIEARKKKYEHHLLAQREKLNQDLDTQEEKQFAEAVLDVLEKSWLIFLEDIRKLEKQLRNDKDRLPPDEKRLPAEAKEKIISNLIVNLKQADIDSYSPKLDDMKIKQEEVDKIGRDRILKNLVMRGFAKFANGQDTRDGILITKEGLLMGEVIWETTKIVCGEKLMKDKWPYWTYKFFLLSAWIIICLGILLLIRQLFPASLAYLGFLLAKIPWLPLTLSLITLAILSIIFIITFLLKLIFFPLSIKKKEVCE